MLTEKAIQEFMVSRGGLRPKSQREYAKHLALFQKAFPHLPVKPLTIQAWLNSLQRQRGKDQKLAPETVNGRFATLRAFYKQIHLWHPGIPNPMSLVRPPGLQAKAMRTFTNEELYRLFRLPLSPDERALLTLLVDVGPRAEECTNLTWEDVTLGYVVLKGKTGGRVVPISETTYRRLKALKIEDGYSQQHVFLGKRGPLTYEGLYKLVRRLCHQAGINGRRCSPHTFRHTFGTNYAAAEGCDPKVLQDIMGHRDFKTTLRYIQNNPKRMALNHQRCTPLKLVDAAAQQSFLDTDRGQAVKEAEAILKRSTG